MTEDDGLKWGKNNDKETQLLMNEKSFLLYEADLSNTSPLLF